jgi:hypothetical protein
MYVLKMLISVSIISRQLGLLSNTYYIYEKNHNGSLETKDFDGE